MTAWRRARISIFVCSLAAALPARAATPRASPGASGGVAQPARTPKAGSTPLAAPAKAAESQPAQSPTAVPTPPTAPAKAAESQPAQSPTAGPTPLTPAAKAADPQSAQAPAPTTELPPQPQAQAGRSPRSKRTKMAVLDVRASGPISPQNVETLTNLIAVEAAQTDMDVMSGPDLRAMIGFERQRKMIGCQDSSCLTEIGGALGVDYLLVSNLSEFGNAWVLTQSLLHVARGRAVERTSRRCKDLSCLVDAASEATRVLTRSFRSGDAAANAGARTTSPATDAPPSPAAPAPSPAEGSPLAAGASPAPSGSAAAPPASTGATAPNASPPSPRRPWLAWTCLGAGAVAAGVGGWLMLDARSTYQEHQRAQASFGQGGITRQEALAAESQSTTGLAVLGAGGAALAGGALWWWLAGREPAPIAASVGADGFGLAFSSQF